MRILQDECMGNIVLADDRLIKMVDNAEIEANKGEISANGPFYGTRGIMYENNVMRYHVCTREGEKGVLKELSGINLTMEDDSDGMDN